MNNPIRIPQAEGVYSRQAHADLPEQAPYEREVSRDGFFGPASQFHHRHAPTGWTHWEGPLRPRAFQLKETLHNAGEVPTHWPWQQPALFSNRHCQYRFVAIHEAMDYLVRNADGDELLFVHEGRGEWFCDYGHLPLNEGDYLVIPRGTQWRLSPSQPMQCLLIEATDQRYLLPDKGLVGQQAIFDPAALDHPRIDDAFLAQQSEQPWQVQIKRHQQISHLHYPFNPLDAVGWHGDVYPVKINWRDIRPLMSHRVHLPPSAHTTFLCEHFVVCTFVPRPIESDPGALKVPFFHCNEEYDELIFYHAGNFFSRDNIAPGMVSLHPAGFPHGPHPKAYANAQTAPKTMTEEVAVMLDTRAALITNEALLAKAEMTDYCNSWQTPQGEHP